MDVGRSGTGIAGRLTVILTTVAVMAGIAIVGAPAVAAADPTASMSIRKASSATDIKPGQKFQYTIQFQCTAGTVSGCLHAGLDDALPPGLTIVGEPSLAGGATGTITHDATTVHVQFTDDVDGEMGLKAGTPSTLTIPVQLDPHYPPIESGKPLTNTATITASNANPKSSSVDVVPDVPIALAAKTTKDIQPASDFPGLGTPATAALTGTSTSNAPVTSLVISDPVDPTAIPNPFTYLQLDPDNPFGSFTMPDGAETVQVRAWSAGTWHDGPVGTTPVLPGDVTAADVTGLQFVFTSTTEPGITPGSAAGVVLNLQQTQAAVEAPKPLVVTNNADTTVSLDQQTATSPPASDTYRVPPTDVEVSASKTFDPATVKAGDPSKVTLGATNQSEGPLDTLTIVEPAPGSPNPFTDGPNPLVFTGLGADGSGGGIVWPTGAEHAEITYVCNGSPTTAVGTDAKDTLPAPPSPACDPQSSVTGFTVTFTATVDGDQGGIVPGAQATIPFLVDTDPGQTDDRITHPNQVGVTGGLRGATDNANDQAALVTLKDRLAVEVNKRVTPSQIPAFPGQIVTAQLTGTVQEFPASTSDAHQIIVQDPPDPIPNPPGSSDWYATFHPRTVTATPIPADSTLTVQYYNGTEWVNVVGMTDIAGPTIFTGTLPAEVTANAQGIRFVYTSTLEAPDGFPPGTTVAPNLTYELDDAHAGPTAEPGPYQNCAASSASNDPLHLTATSDPACDDVTLTPVDPGSLHPVTKAWDDPAVVPERSGEERGLTIHFGTGGWTGLSDGWVTDFAPETTPLTQSSYDEFDLVRIDPITPDLDPLLTFDQIAAVLLYQVDPANPDPANGTWVEATNDPCPARCDGTFPGYTLTPQERASTVAFRLVYDESPTRIDRIAKPTDPTVGSGIAAALDNVRGVHVVYQLRDVLRSNPRIPVTYDRTYNIADEPGFVRNTAGVRAIRGDGLISRDYVDSDDIQITQVPLNVEVSKQWTGGPLGIPAAGVPFPDQWPTGRVQVTGTNATASKVDRLVITDPTGGTNPFDAFNLKGFASITDPATIGADTLEIVLAGSTVCTAASPCDLDQALGLDEAQLSDVVGMTLTYSGRILAGATATVIFDTRLRPTSRSTETPPADNQTFTNQVTAETQDLVGLDAPLKSLDASKDASITTQQSGIGVQAGKSFDPTGLTEPATGPVAVTLTGQPSGPSRTVSMVLGDTSPTFWNAYDLVSLSDITLTAPIEQVQVEAHTGGTWSVDPDTGAPVLTGGQWHVADPTSGPTLTLPEGLSPGTVNGLRFTFTKVDDSNWENPANPTQAVTFTVARRDTLHTGGPVLPDVQGNPASPGETAPGVATDIVTADVTSSDRDVDGNPLTAHHETEATITYHHATNAVAVTKSPDGDTQKPGNPFTYSLTMKNTGQVPIVDPVVTDYLPVDGAGPLLELADPPNYQFTLADGTGMPTRAADVTIVENVTGTEPTIRFTFPDGSVLPVGASYTISFAMQTRPGLDAGVSVTNSFGVVADRPWDQCDGTLDRPTGECRADATNTVETFGNLAVHKLVKAQGSDDLGVIIDPAVNNPPTCAPNADGFYARPCVPVAEPGGIITWRLEFVNTGNLPVDRIVAVDRLPALDDHLATDPDLVRGSQWRPLLQGPRPTLATGSGVLNVWYTTQTNPCTDDLDTDETLCPPADWVEWPAGQNLPVDPDTVTGLKFEMVPATPIPPTGTVDVDLTMVAPAFSPTAGADTIANNTVGMSGRWVSGDTTGYTLTSEPPRVGVALATGPIRLVKKVDGDGASFAPVSFPVTVSCTSVGQDVPLPDDVAHQTLTANEPVTVEDLPYHATCTLTEGANGQTSSTVQTAVVQRDISEVETVTLTNTYDLASLAVTKRVDSPAVDQDGAPVGYGPFTVDVSCTFLGKAVYATGFGPDTPMTADLSDGQTATFTGLPAGAACTVTESDDKGASTTTVVTTAGEQDPVTSHGTSGTVELAPDDGDRAANTAEITNTFGAGPLRLVKEVTGDAAATYGIGPFVLSVDCVLSDPTGTRTVWHGPVTLGGKDPLEATIDNIALGAACTVSETDDGGASGVSVDPSEPVVIGSTDGPVTVTVTNSFDPAKLLVDKKVDGDAASYAPDSFPVEVTCTANGAVLPGFPVTVAVTPGTPTEVDTLVGAECTAVETDSGSATEISYDPTPTGEVSGSAPVLIPPVGDSAGAPGPAVITITNTYRAGGLQILKDLTGPGASIAQGPFVFDVTCSFNGEATAFTRAVTLTRASDATTLASEVITGLPVGAECTVTETDSGGADATPDPVTVTVPDVDESGAARVAVASLVNPFSAGTVAVHKVVTGAGAADHAGDVFRVAVTCQIEVSGERLTLYSGTVSVAGGQTVTISGPSGDPVLLPVGAHCFATETDAGGADAATVDFDSYQRAAVVTVGDAGEQAQRLTITVTNTFDATAPPTTLPNTGAPITVQLWWTVILLGAGLALLAAGDLRRVRGARGRHR